MWLMLIFFCPVGIILCYVNRERHPHWKVICGVFLVLFVIGLMSPKHDEPKPSNSSGSSKIEQQVDQAAQKPKDKEQKPKDKEQKAKEYTAVEVTTMDEDLKNNAAAAQKKYKGKNLKVTGRVNVIDSDGSYISIVDTSNPYAILGVRCDINKKDKAQEDYVLNIKKDQIVTVCGTISDVGEVFGYSMKVDKFE